MCRVQAKAASHDETGSVTVEVALGIVGLMCVVGIVCTGFAAASAQAGACADARDVLRQATRGAALPPTVSSVAVSHEGQWVSVDATRSLAFGHLIGVGSMSCHVTGLLEGTR